MEQVVPEYTFLLSLKAVAWYLTIEHILSCTCPAVGVGDVAYLMLSPSSFSKYFLQCRFDLHLDDVFFHIVVLVGIYVDVRICDVVSANILSSLFVQV